MLTVPSPSSRFFPSEESLPLDLQRVERQHHTSPLDSCGYYVYLSRRLVSDIDPTTIPEAALQQVRGFRALSAAQEMWIRQNGAVWVIDHRERTARQIHEVRAAGSEAGYWSFRERHPNHRAISKQAVETAILILALDQARSILSSDTPPLFARENGAELLRTLRSLDGMDGMEKTYITAGVLAVAARDPRCVATLQRLGSRSTIVPDNESVPCGPPWYWRIANVVPFFGTANMYFGRLTTLEESRTGDIVETGKWHIYVKTLVKEWSDSNLLATILIGATVGLLAVPNVTWDIQLVLFLSILFSVGSVFVGMFFMWQHQINGDSAGDIGAAYLDRADAIPGKRRAFAFLLALPLVLLLWALLAFVLSVVLFSLGGFKLAPDGSPGASAQRLVSSIGVVLFLCIVLSLSAFWHIWHSERKPGM